jgi:hypothetical protein
MAVELGTNHEKRNVIREKVLNNMHKLFYQQSAVDSWIEVFQRMIDEY